MLSLPPHLRDRCREIFLQCDEFEDKRSLRALFVVDQLLPFIHKLPEASQKSERVEQCLTYLLTKELDGKHPVLPVFIAELRKKYEDGDALYAELEDIRVEIEMLSRSRTSAEMQPRYDLAQPWNFDLTELIKCILNELIRRKNGVIGFGLSYENVKFLEFLCNRIEHEWGREKFSYIYNSLKIDPISLPWEKAVKRVIKYKGNVKEGDVLFGIEASEDNMRLFWQGLCEEIGHERLPRRLIIILVTHITHGFPEQIVPLPRPQFDSSDIHNWVKQIVQSFHLSETVVEPWRDLMIHECCEEDSLEIQAVYMHIKYMLNKLRRNPTIHCFQQDLEERNLHHVQASN